MLSPPSWQIAIPLLIALLILGVLFILGIKLCIVLKVRRIKEHHCVAFYSCLSNCNCVCHSEKNLSTSTVEPSQHETQGTIEKFHVDSTASLLLAQTGVMLISDVIIE